MEIDIAEETSLYASKNIEFSDIEGATSLFVGQEHSGQSVTEEVEDLQSGVDDSNIKSENLEHESSFCK